MRSRLNLAALAAGVWPEADLYPQLVGLTAILRISPERQLETATLVLHTRSPEAARRLVDRVLKPLLRPFLKNDVPEQADPAADGPPAHLGNLAGQPLEAALRESSLLLSWGKDAASLCLQARDHPQLSAATLLRQKTWPTTAKQPPPRRLGIAWPGRLAPGPQPRPSRRYPLPGTPHRLERHPRRPTHHARCLHLVPAEPLGSYLPGTDTTRSPTLWSNPVTTSPTPAPAAAKPPRPRRRPARLVDLRIRWLDQYAPECGWTSLNLDPETLKSRKNRLEGYLGSTAAAVLVAPCEPDVPDPWRFLTDLLARYEAEFCGRLLYDAADAARWRDEPPDSLTWGLLAVEACHNMPDRLADLWHRGVRLFQPATGTLPTTRLDPGALIAILQTLESLTTPENTTPGPRPGFDFAGLDLLSATQALDWFEASPERGERLVPVLTCGSPAADTAEATSPNSEADATWPLPLLARLRALGGTIGLPLGPPWHPDADSLARAIGRLSALPFRGQEGHLGLAFATRFMRADQLAPGLETVPRLIDWSHKKNQAFDADIAEALLHENARAFLARLVGEPPS